MGHVTKERHWSNNYQHLFINWEAKDIDHSIFIKVCKDFANVLSDTRVSEKYVDPVIMACRFAPAKWPQQEVFSENRGKNLFYVLIFLYLTTKTEYIVFSFHTEAFALNARTGRFNAQDHQHFLKSLQIGSVVNPFTMQVMEINLKIMSAD